MNIYIKNQNNNGLVSVGEMIQIGGAKQNCIVTFLKDRIVVLGQYKDIETTHEVFEYISGRITNPNEKELKKRCIYIDLCELDKNISSQE